MELDGKITKVIAKLDVLLDPKAALLNGLLDMEKRQSGKNKKGGVEKMSKGRRTVIEHEGNI